MFHIAVCDDEKIICEEIRTFAQRYAEEKTCSVDCSIFLSGEALYESLARGNYYDVIFLDIELFHISGIEIGEYIRRQLKDMLSQIVYISSRPEYAMELFATHPLDFLTKPISFEKFSVCLNQTAELKSKRGAFFSYNCRGEYRRIPLSNILYFESQNRKVCVTRVNCREAYYGKLNEVENQVKYYGFLRIHKSFIVNPQYVEVYGKTTITITNRDVLPVSREKQTEIANQIIPEILCE